MLVSVGDLCDAILALKDKLFSQRGGGGVAWSTCEQIERVNSSWDISLSNRMASVRDVSTLLSHFWAFQSRVSFLLRQEGEREQGSRGQ